MPEIPDQALGPDASSDGGAAGMTRQQLAEARQYGRQTLVCDLADRLLDVAYLAIFALVLARPVDQWLGGFAPLAAPAPRLAAVFALVTLLHAVVSFPLSWYSGHVLEQRYGLSRQSFGRWLWRYAKRNGLALALGLVLTQGLFWVIWLSGAAWWLWAAAGFFLVGVVLGQLAPVVILPLFYRVERLDDPRLAERLTRLAEGTGLSLEGVYRLELSAETAKANAMLAGLGRTRRVILGDTLLDHFSPDEIEVVFAHEVGHHVHRHMPKLMLAGLGFSTLAFWACDRAVGLWLAREVGAWSYGALPVFTLPLLMLAITLFSLLLEPAQNALSRRFERQADRYAVQRTGMAAAFRSALQKLARRNKADPHPHPLEVLLFHSHPPIAERLAQVERA